MHIYYIHNIIWSLNKNNSMFVNHKHYTEVKIKHNMLLLLIMHV